MAFDVTRLSQTKSPYLSPRLNFIVNTTIGVVLLILALFGIIWRIEDIQSVDFIVLAVWFLQIVLFLVLGIIFLFRGITNFRTWRNPPIKSESE